MVAHIFIKLSQNVYLIKCTFLYIDMPNVTASYGTPFAFIAFIVIFTLRRLRLTYLMLKITPMNCIIYDLIDPN